MFFAFWFISREHPSMGKPCADFQPERCAQLVPMETFLHPRIAVTYEDGRSMARLVEPHLGAKKADVL